jgi:hypothetical protein
MRIVLNHVTRMKTHQRICIAGIEQAEGRHVRPTTSRDELLTRRLLAAEGGFVEPGALVDIGDPIPEPARPEVEDYRCALAAIRPVRRLRGDEYLELLDRMAENAVEDIFGPDLYRETRWKYALEPNSGSASLGVLRAERFEVEIDRYGKVAVRLDDPHPRAYATVTDVRFFEEDHETPRPERIDDVNRRIRSSTEAFLMVGLSRPFAKTGNLHWLQVNGICLADRPLGERP